MTKPDNPPPVRASFNFTAYLANKAETIEQAVVISIKNNEQMKLIDIFDN